MKNMSEYITPRVLKGFRDYLPQLEIKRQVLTETLRSTFRRYGFIPIDTPALEYTEVLLRKSDGETEKQMFRFTDNGGRDVALRFDLTVPLARFIAEHKNELLFPFKRYHIAPVWRGEKPQAGRFREFIQCDFDIVGVDNSESDYEVIHLIAESFIAMNIQEISIHISHRGLFNRFLEILNIREKSEAILRTVDKLAKIGKDEVARLLSELCSKEKAERILDFITIGKSESSNDKPLGFLEAVEKIEALTQGVSPESTRLREVYALLEATGKQNFVVFDPSITRGLDYYTGIVFETFLDKLPDIGSVCSGGRYNNLAHLYTKEHVPGVGASIGLDRLIAATEQLHILTDRTCFTKALIFYESGLSSSLMYTLANFLTKHGAPTEVFSENKKITAQYAWAEAKGIPYGIFLTEAFEPNIDLNTLSISVKNLLTREQTSMLVSEFLLKVIGAQLNVKSGESSLSEFLLKVIET